MSQSAWKTLASSLKKIVKGSEDKEPTEKQLETVKAHLGELNVLTARLELEDEDSSSESESDDSESEESDSCDSDDSVECDGDSCSTSEKRKYKKGRVLWGTVCSFNMEELVPNGARSLKSTKTGIMKGIRTTCNVL